MRLFAPNLSNPVIPEFHSKRVIVALGRGLLQLIFEYQQLMGNKITLQYDQVSPEVYLYFGRVFLNSYRAGEDSKRLFDAQRGILKENFLGVQAFIVHGETEQPYFLDPADRPPLSTTTTVDNLVAAVSATVTAAETAAEAAAQSSSMPARAAAVFEQARDVSLSEQGLKAIRGCEDLFSVVFRMLASLLSVQGVDPREQLTHMIISDVRFVRVLSIVLSIIERCDLSQMKGSWEVIERKHCHKDFDGIGQLAHTYKGNREGLLSRIAVCDKKHRYIERVEALTGSPSGWGSINHARFGPSIWKQFESQADADAIVAHVGDQVEASSHQVKGSSAYLVVIKRDSIALEEADRPDQEESGAAAAGGPS